MSLLFQMLTVGYLVSSAPSSREETAAWQFLSVRKDAKAQRIDFSLLRASNIDFGELSRAAKSHISKLPNVLWWHYESSEQIPSEALDPNVLSALRAYVERGGSLLLSLSAAQYVVDLGFEEIRPNHIAHGAWNQSSWAKDYPDIRGFASFQGHPIFSGLTNGVYTWNPTPESPHAAAVYDGISPKNGKCVAVERLYIKLNESWRIAHEYRVGKGRVLTVGAFFYFAEQQHRFRAHLEKFAMNSLLYLAKQGKEKATYWNFGERTVQEESRPLSSPVSKLNSAWKGTHSDLTIQQELTAESKAQSFDVGGRRTLVMGKERGGINEVWVHPFRILKNLRVGVRVGGNAIEFTDALNPKLTFTPEALTRSYQVDGATVEETVYSHFDKPAGAIHIRSDAEQNIEFFITGQIDLRLMWPLRDDATGSLKYSWDRNLRAFVIQNATGELVAVVGSSLKPMDKLAGQFSEIVMENGPLVGKPTGTIQVAFAMRIPLNKSRREFTFVFAGSNQGAREAVDSYRSLIANPQRALDEQSKHFKKLADRSVRIVSPDSTFNAAYQWTLAETDRFIATTPQLGTSLLAGIGTTERGWDSGHKISGRPGYAWYFGRDAVWSALAMLGYGDFETVRNVLEFLGAHQDLNGKVLHEYTTSGFIHYDASDATPLYILLMGRYLKASGDVAFVREQFARLRKAIEFCFSTDTDGDHLIENTNVGHGWVEGGGLFPVHTEHYLASIWSAALGEASAVAHALKKHSLAASWEKESNAVAEIVKKEFWNPQTNFYNFAKRQDGSFNAEKTILPAVGMYLGVADTEHAGASLTEFVSANFSADWGTRILGRDNPMFNPTGYHYGSVWPLFTGWNALAQFRWHRYAQGFQTVASNLALSSPFAAGYIPEVLRGDSLEEAGVCSHQAWSETMALQPLLEGMLGLRVNALKNEVELRPWFPPQWNEARVERIRVGKAVVSFEMKKTGVGFPPESPASPDSSGSGWDAPLAHRFQFRGSGKKLRVKFQPMLMLGTQVKEMRLGKKVVGKNKLIRSYADSPEVEFTLDSYATVEILSSGGVGVVPPANNLRQGQPSEQLRLLDERWDDGRYYLTVEGLSGEVYDLRIVDADAELHASDEGVALTRTGHELVARVAFDGPPGFVRKRIEFR
jgi:glycogen debranching enzyme